MKRLRCRLGFHDPWHTAIGLMSSTTMVFWFWL